MKEGNEAVALFFFNKTSVFKKFWTVPSDARGGSGSGGGGGGGRRGDSASAAAAAAAAANAIDELQYLGGHSDIVRHMLRVDERRLASGGDDGTVQLWDHATGARLHALAGHSRPVTCLLLLDRGVLLSGSSDKAIRVWDLRSGACAQVLERHAGSVRCLAKMLPPSSSNRSQLHQQQPRFCSGANDRSIHVWRLEAGKTQVELVGTIERSEEESAPFSFSVSVSRSSS